MNKRDVSESRGIWYVMTLVSLVALAISINLLWPKHEPSKSRFFKDCAVSATIFYAVMLFRYFFNEFTTPIERIPHLLNSGYIWAFDRPVIHIERLRQNLISQLAIVVVIYSPLIYKVLIQEYVVSVSLFTISLFTGGIGLIQLSDKLRMETVHAWLTLFVGWLLCLSGMYICSSYDHNTSRQALQVGIVELSVSITIFSVLHAIKT